ncbi:hypothetical protein BDZ90DRAFT_278842 [Jaminaea rosea]|uniref:OPA3-domain-containing protein n=1 Tax=Jaminaea rosea TaxID=1569628 RepID=A0A316UT54_9BASI|nr:hypothetical protein BDZ90DRAFT_278842 [Jaminaea rosea]PWN28479.1 hypothetical protein BDZ90DRAFT_278842 [Jaminaea rosea]
MATTKLATLFIRTLAKPIATQLKTQAAQHESFRRVCVAIAQTMHRSEMALRYGLLPKAPMRAHIPRAEAKAGEDGGEEGKEKERERPKVRPLNEAKAIANGANFLSEAFLFLIAAALILGESYRSSAKNKKQRNRTEEKVEEVARAVDALCVRLGVDPRAVGLDLSKEGEDGESEGEGEDGPQSDEQLEASRHAAAAMHRRREDEDEVKRLRAAVSVLLKMALKSGWVQGGEALDLSKILDGADGAGSGSSGASGEQSQAEGGRGQSQADEQDKEPSASPILDQVAKARARQLAEMSRVSPSSGNTSA